MGVNGNEDRWMEWVEWWVGVMEWVGWGDGGVG